jgi:hypothetical protein
VAFVSCWNFICLFDRSFEEVIMSDKNDLEWAIRDKTDKLQKQHSKKDMQRLLYAWVKEGNVTLKVYIGLIDWIENRWKDNDFSFSA